MSSNEISDCPHHRYSTHLMLLAFFRPSVLYATVCWQLDETHAGSQAGTNRIANALIKLSQWCPSLTMLFGHFYRTRHMLRCPCSLPSKHAMKCKYFDPRRKQNRAVCYVITVSRRKTGNLAPRNLPQSNELYCVLRGRNNDRYPYP